MNDDSVGYGKPPKSRQFKPGVSGNPKGRPKRKPTALADIINDALDGSIDYREKGCAKVAPALALSLRILIDRAVAGDVDAADLALKFRMPAERLDVSFAEPILVEDWLPNYPGQTAEQETADMTARHDAGPVEWWELSDE